MGIELKTDIEKTSYALGLNFAQSLRQLPKEIKVEAVTQAITDIFETGEPALSREDFIVTMNSFQKEMQALEEKTRKELQELNAKEQQAFLDKNRSEDGVQETASGLQYKILKEGDGEKPAADDMVKVNYTATLLNGNVFDSSEKRGQPAEFKVNQLIKGWSEGLQLMNVGSSFKLFIPAELAYGERGFQQVIPPGAMLAFEVELLEIKK